MKSISTLLIAKKMLSLEHISTEAAKSNIKPDFCKTSSSAAV
jgi:hypothetical protein